MLVITLVVNLLPENLLEPVLLGGSLDLHPLLILLATSLGGIIAGMIGLILAAPALAVALDVNDELTTAGFFDKLSPGDSNPRSCMATSRRHVEQHQPTPHSMTKGNH